MNIKKIGGEFELIQRLVRKNTNPNIIKGIGDDCAVLEYSKNKYLLVTTDMMVENDHFNLKWQSPFQIGRKLMEVNVSDIVCKGGTPTFALISISITKETSVGFIDELYKGLYKSADRHGVSIVGGDTTHGTEYVFNLTLLGEVKKTLLRLRSDAKVGDLICVTGKLGGSTAGLKLLENNKKGFLKDHLEPKSKTTKIGQIIAKYAHAMIDVSDGLSGEVKHICENSHVGAVIYFDKIPISKETIISAKKTGLDPYDFALYGGEDFQIVFTVNEKEIKKLQKELNDFTVVGKILDKKEKIYILKDKKRKMITKGYDHFS
jgi:thiamine-monophosphate kinase